MELKVKTYEHRIGWAAATPQTHAAFLEDLETYIKQAYATVPSEQGAKENQR